MAHRPTPETEAQRCWRIGNALAEKGKYADAIQWWKLAERTADGLDKAYDYFLI